MRFGETGLAGVWLIELDPIEDERGWFARTFDLDAFAERGLDAPVQCNASFNACAGTLRGMHYQRAPHGESKLVRCIRGAAFDVAVDLRAGSPTHGRWFAVELSAENRRSLYIPPGLAHGFQTLRDATELSYQMGHRYVPEAAAGVRWDDPAFAIRWPDPPAAGRIISAQDLSYADYGQ